MTKADLSHSLQRHISKAAASCALCVSLVFSLFFCALPGSSAYAEIAKSDVIGYATLEDRGLPASLAPNIDAKYAYLTDSLGNVYFSREPDKQVPIASVTKIMTAVVALEAAPLDTTIVVSTNAGEVGESSSSLIAGDELTLQNALIGLMVSSGNDAAIAIAESLGKTILDTAQSEGSELVREDGTAISKGDSSASYDAFIAAMNRKAQELNCTNTLFTNPHGLDFGAYEGNQHSTAKDVATISAYAMKSDIFRDIVKMEHASFPVKRGSATTTIKVESTDTMLGNYEGACGIKTGFTDRAGDCFVGACERGGTYLYAVILNAPSHEQRFKDTATLFDWVYANQKSVKLANSDIAYDMMEDGQYKSVPIVAYVPLADWIDKTVPATFADPNAEVSISAIFGNVSQDIHIEEVSGSVEAGQVIGSADFYQNNVKIASQDIVACESIAAPDILQSMSIAWDRLMNNFSGKPNVATPSILNTMPIILPKA